LRLLREAGKLRHPSLAAALHLYCGVQASADFAKHILINPCAVPIWTGHPCQARRTLSCRGFGLKPGIAIWTVDLIGMPVTQGFDDRAQTHENRFAQRFRVDRRRILQARAKLLKRFPISPCPVVTWTSHSANPDSYPGVESFFALRAVDWLEILLSQPVDYLRITLAGPLILASHLCQVEFVSETVSLVAHVCLQEEVQRRQLVNSDSRRTLLPQILPSEQVAN
jgi:hypothetical protein